MKAVVVLSLVLMLGVTFGASIFSTTNNRQLGILAELQNIDNTDFGKKLLDTISLQLKNKSPLSDISKLLSEIRSELVHQQEKSDAEEGQAARECHKQIRNYNSRIDKATNEINEAIVNIANHKRNIASFETQQKSYEAQIKLLGEKEVQFREARKKDEADFANRIAQQKAVVTALEQITPELEHLKPHGNVHAALVELAKIGRSNPIGALLQVAMTLDPGALQRVIQHLNKLKESVAASIEDDIKAEADAKRNFDKMIGEFRDERTNLENSLTQVKQQLEAEKQQLHTQEVRLADNQKELKTATEGKTKTIKMCDERKARYNTEKAARAKEIGIVEKVLQIIASRLDNMQDYITKRVNK